MAAHAEHVRIESDSDVILCREVVRGWAVREGLGLVDQTKLVTAASELARNALQHGGGGMMDIARAPENGSGGLRLVFRDRGPGIADIALALTDGYSTGGGLGLGLPASRRLVDELTVRSSPGRGTTVTAVMWRRARSRARA